MGMNNCFENSSYLPQVGVFSLCELCALRQKFGDANSADLSFRVTRHLLDVHYEQLLNHHSEHPGYQYVIVIKCLYNNAVKCQIIINSRY